MASAIDMSGMTFGRLTVLRLTSTAPKRMWACKCSCGNDVIVGGSHLRSGLTKSCGCFRVDTNRQAQLQHGLSDSDEMRIWGLIKDRCTNQKSKAYNRYGGRGIEMCEEWRNSFVAFYEDMGRRPSARHSIDRIDNNKGYSPANCRWSVPVEQQNNRRDNRLLSYAGQVETASNWARILGVRPGLLIARINAGWETERAFLTPAKASKPKPNGATR